MSDEGAAKHPEQVESIDDSDSSMVPNALAAILEDAKQRKNALDTQISSTTTSLAELLTAAKGNLSEIDATKTAVATMKGALDEMQRTATADVSAVAQSKTDVDKLKADAQSIAKHVEGDFDEITKKVTALQEQQNALKDLLGELGILKVDAKNKIDDVTANVTAITTAKTAFDSLSTQTKTAHDELITRQNDVAAQLAEIAESNDAVKQLHAALFSDTADRKAVKTSIDELQAQLGVILSDAEKQRGVAITELEALKEKSAAELGKFSSDEQARFADLYNRLQEQILSLLPSAGSAGLASTYYDAKSKYAVTSFHGAIGADGKERQPSKLRNLFGHNPTSMIATIFFYGLFLGPVAVIIWLFFDVLNKMSGPTPVTFSNQYLVFKALIAVPLGTMSLFGYSSLRLYRRLYEEYNYKQRVMELYLSFAREIESKGDEDQKKALLAIMLKAVADKPSVNMHKYDGMGSDSGWKIDLSSMLNRLLGPVK